MAPRATSFTCTSGESAGSKLAKAQELGLTVLDEAGLPTAGPHPRHQLRAHRMAGDRAIDEEVLLALLENLQGEPPCILLGGEMLAHRLVGHALEHSVTKPAR